MGKLMIIAVLLVTFTGTAYAETINITVNGLVCSFCAAGIEKTFKQQAAVETVKVDLDNQLVTIHTKNNQNLDDTTVTKLITDAGYTVVAVTREK